MKVLIFSIFFVSLQVSIFAANLKLRNNASWEIEHWIELPLDHFNLFDNRTWKMRYFINDEFFQKDMPMFIEIGGEWTVDGETLTKGQMYLLAKKHNGFLVATEHRYYGKSLPFIHFTTENLRYLQIEQALEDLVYLIEHLKSSRPGFENSKVVVHGCSYAGMLATWVRSRFPTTVDIGYASSAPLGVELDYPEYYEVLNDVYANVSVSCIDTIKEGFLEAEELLKTKEGRKTVLNAFKKWNCDEIDDDMHSGDIIWNMISVLNVQYDPVQYEEIGCLAMSMDTDELTPFERLVNFLVLKSKDRESCAPSETTDEEDNNFDFIFQANAWTYQTCTEMGFFQTLNRKNPRNPFPVDITLEGSVNSCIEQFGKGITEQLIKTGIQRVIRRYGGKHPAVTKLLTVHGMADPWRALGIPEEINPEAPVIILKESTPSSIIFTSLSTFPTFAPFPSSPNLFFSTKHNGFLVATEHRYYGKSLPFTDFTTENLRYLQIEQALEHLVYLIEHLKSSRPGLENSKVVVHGCSYAGMLATWVRSRFPTTVDIGYASSAPLGVELDYPEYYEVLNDVYANVSVSCIVTIKKGFLEAEELLKTKEGRKTVVNALKKWNCEIDDDMHSGDIIWNMINVLNVQYDPVQYEEVGCLVMSMDTDELPPFERLVNFVVLKSKNKNSCASSETTEEEDKDTEAWVYQTCTEVGFFQTLNRKNPRNPFPVDISLEGSVNSCIDQFGEGITEQLIKTGIQRVIRRYGGKHPAVTKLLTVHGMADPWRALGIPEEINPEAPVIILKGSHCVDDSVREDDPPETIKSRETIRNIISKWIEQL